MKHWAITTMVTILIMLSKPLFAQNSDQRKYSIQIDFGVSKTLHYNQPINFRICVEGCFAEEQIAKMAPNFDLSLYRNFDKENSVKIGIGFSEYRYWEKGMLSPGGGALSPYERKEELRYFAFSGGYKRIFQTRSLISLFLEVEFLYEIYRNESYYLREGGVAIKPQIGALARVSDKLIILFDGFYKSGILPYDYNSDYIPYGYGLEVAMNLKL